MPRFEVAPADLHPALREADPDLCSVLAGIRDIFCALARGVELALANPDPARARSVLAAVYSLLDDVAATALPPRPGSSEPSAETRY